MAACRLPADKGRAKAGGRQGAFFATKQSFVIQLNRDCFNP
jgi:hypothetical protein